MLADLERRMHEHARNLEFEEAAQLRDQLRAIREERLMA
jgi:excinuclease ABC subunit B